MKASKDIIQSLYVISMGTKTFNMFVAFCIVVVLPLIWSINIPHHRELAIIIGIAFPLNLLFYRTFSYLYFKYKSKRLKWIQVLENITDTLLFAGFIHYVGGLNGPFFFGMGYNVMESCLNLTTALPFAIGALSAFLVIWEYVVFVAHGAIVFDAISVFILIFRCAFLMFLAWYGSALAKSVLVERRDREKIQEQAGKIQEQTKQLEGALSELQKADKAKSEFLSMASHQLRTPLTAIKGYLSLIQEGDYGQTARPMAKPLINMSASVERLIKLVNDLLGISKIELGSMRVDRKLVQIEELLKSCFEEAHMRAKQKKLNFVFQKPKTLLPKVLIDELAIRQAILNLLDNAIRYTLTGEVILAVEQKAGRVLIKVQDTGEGFTEEERKNLFQSFTRGSAGADLFIEGTGLGLCVARKYIELHQGKIWAESSGKGKGSTFYIELPVS
jgi:signal transduction histidine kinase